MEFQLNSIQAVALLVSIMISVTGGGTFFYNWYKEPNLVNGQWFESAWLEYGINQNTLNVVHIPDGTGQRVFLAVHEAVNRVDDKSWNPAVDTKPLKVNIYLVDDTNYTYTGSILVCGKLMHKMCSESHEERIRDMATLLGYTDIPSFNNIQYNVMSPNGSVAHASLDDHYEFWTDPARVLKLYSNESLQRKIDAL